MFKQIAAGLVLGIMITLIGILLCVLILLPSSDLTYVFEELLRKKIVTKVITLGALPNVLVFHLLIRNRRDYIARGVLLAVVLLAILLVILKIAQ